MADTLGAGGLWHDPLWRVQVELDDLERALSGCWWVRRLALVDHLAPGERVARAAALVHDVGHTPFSHTLEGVNGADHHQVGASRVAELDDLLREHGLDAERVLDVAQGRVPSALSSGSALGLDHLDSLVRSPAAHGRTREMASVTLARLRLVGGAVDTDTDTAAHLVELVAAEAASQTPEVSLVVTAVLRHLVARALDGATPGRREEVAAMNDGQALALLGADARTTADAHLLLADPGAWTAHRADQDGEELAEDEGSVDIEVHRLHLALPLVDGQVIAPDQRALAGLPHVPARYAVRRREHR